MEHKVPSFGAASHEYLYLILAFSKTEDHTNICVTKHIIISVLLLPTSLSHSRCFRPSTLFPNLSHNTQLSVFSCSSILFVWRLTLSQSSNKEFFLFKREEGKCGLAIAVFSLGSQDKRIKKWKHFLIKYFYSLPTEVVWCRADWRRIRELGKWKKRF